MQGLVASDITTPSQEIEDISGCRKLLIGGEVIPAMGAKVLKLKRATMAATPEARHFATTVPGLKRRTRVSSLTSMGIFLRFMTKYPEGSFVAGMGIR